MAGREIWVMRPPRQLILEPGGEHAEEVISKLPEGRPVKLTLTRSRNPERLRLYWELCHRVAEMLVAAGWELETKESVDARYRVAAGLCTETPISMARRKAYGCTHMVLPRSISFAKMSQEEFDRYWTIVRSFTLTDLLPHLPASELRARVEDLLTMKEGVS